MDIFHKKADQNSHVDVINLCKFNKCMLSLGYALKIRFSSVVSSSCALLSSEKEIKLKFFPTEKSSVFRNKMYVARDKHKLFRRRWKNTFPSHMGFT